MMNGNKVTELAARAASVSTRLEQIYSERRSLSLSASENDKTALSRIAAIDAEARERLAKKMMLTDAVCLAEEQDRTRQAEREAADRERHLAAANKIAAAALSLSAEIDKQLVALTRAFEARADLLARLSRTGCLAPHVSLRYVTKSAPTAAARSAGLDKFVDIAHIAPSHARPLAETSAVLRNAMTWPAEQKTAPATPPLPPTPSSPTRRFRLFGGQP
jgi:hypothetical protein